MFSISCNYILFDSDSDERIPLSATTCRGIMKVVKDGEKPLVYCTVDANAGLDARKKAKEAADRERDERLGDGIGVIPTLSKQSVFFYALELMWRSASLPLFKLTSIG